ncbi:hypothetical protein [Streptomyces sp. NPDC048527]|uniref:hypothetical protein n=1 Tax=Streptomyces sp. NPDC048527 TaxID=3365568 RepID=UPI0037147FF9
MTAVGKAELISAVANGGALGFVTALTQPTPEDLAKGNRPHPRDDRQAVWRQPHYPAHHQPGSLR